MKRITFEPWAKGSDGIYNIYVNGEQIKDGDLTAAIHISREISVTSKDEVTIYFPQNGVYSTANFPNPHSKKIIFSFARKYVRLFI